MHWLNDRAPACAPSVLHMLHAGESIGQAHSLRVKLDTLAERFDSLVVLLGAKRSVAALLLLHSGRLV